MLFVEIAMIIGFLRYFLSGKNKQDEITYAADLDRQIKAAEAEAAEEAEAKKNKKKRFGKASASE